MVKHCPLALVITTHQAGYRHGTRHTGQTSLIVLITGVTVSLAGVSMVTEGHSSSPDSSLRSDRVNTRQRF